MKKVWCSLWLLFTLQVSAEEKTIYLTSLDWPPYTGAALADYGAAAAVAKAAFAAMGYTLKIEFYPWSRAVNLAKTDAKYAGYFPEYYATDNAQLFNYSEPMGHGALGFAERKEQPIVWTTLSELSKYKIGTVQDYVNTDEFDKKVAAKQLNVDITSSDSQNLLKLANARIDLAVVDKNVFHYLLGNDKQLAAVTNLQFNSQILEDKKLYICFNKSGTGTQARQIFNEGLKKIDVDAIMAKYLH